VSEISQLINIIKESACDIYKELGGGYNEVVYEESMALELRERGINYDVEKNTEIFYKGVKVGIHRLDFIVERKLVVELKAQPSFYPCSFQEFMETFSFSIHKGKRKPANMFNNMRETIRKFEEDEKNKEEK